MQNDDYTTTMTELIELMRIIGNDTQLCEVKESKRKLSSSITDTLSAFSNGSGGYIISVSPKKPASRLSRASTRVRCRRP
jgi:ATP-dependent DNA helicase RecG